MCDFTSTFRYIDGLENVKKTYFFFLEKICPVYKNEQNYISRTLDNLVSWCKLVRF